MAVQRRINCTLGAGTLVDWLLEEVSDAKAAFLANQFSLPVETVRDLAQYDPSDGKCLTWIIKQVRSGGLNFPEDGEKVRQTLAQFRQLAAKPAFTGEKDINRYASLADLTAAVNANSAVRTKGDQKRSAEMQGCQLLKDEGEFKLYKVTTAEAAAKLFRNTKWCIRDPEYFNAYESTFYYVERNGKPYALCSAHGGEVQDVFDEPIDEPDAGLVDVLKPYVDLNRTPFEEYELASWLEPRMQALGLRHFPPEDDPWWNSEAARAIEQEVEANWRW